MNWPTAALGEIAEIDMGQAPPGDSYNGEGNGIPLIAGASDFGDLTPRPTRHTNAPTKVSRTGDIILCIRATIGDLNLSDQPYCLGRGVAGLRPKPKRLNHRFLWRALEANADNLRSRGRGATFLQVSKSDIANLEITLPPLDEQKRIAGILDQADALCRLRAQALDKLNTLGQAIFHEMFGDPTANIKDLPVKSLGEVCSFISGGTPNKSNPLFWGGDFPWVSPKDMKKLRICDAEDHVTQQAFESTNLKTIEIDTPLIVVRGMILAHTVPLAITTRPVAINQDMKAIKFDDTVIPEFGLWCLKAQHDSILTRVDTAAHGTKRLDTEVLKTLPIFSLPKESQNEFIEKIYECDRQISRYRKQILDFEKIFSSLQHHAFRGEL